MRGTGASWGDALGYLLVVLHLLGTPGDAQRREEYVNRDDYYDDPLPTNETTQNEIAELNRAILNCCNKTGIDVLSNVQNLSKIITTKIEGLADKEDVTNLQNELDELATKSAVTYLQGKLDDLPTMDTILNYTEHITDKFTTLVKKLEEMEERIQKCLDNITFCDEKEDSPITTIPEASTCEDTVFLNLPYGMDVCYDVVAKRLCDTDPLFGFHCCTSCVFAKQIPSNGPHRYVNAPRKVNYSAGLLLQG